MTIAYSDRARRSLNQAPEQIRRAFFKQVRFLADNLNHPSLHAKKFDESQDLWQARVDRQWRFYFLIQGDTYYIVDVMPHPR
jgi:mRNA-degrading endonuclease RelE of RelBE toxin-antitoxin system